MVNIFFIVPDSQQIFSEFPEIHPEKHFSQKSWNSSWMVKKSRDFSSDITFSENTSKLHIILKKGKFWFLYFKIILLIALSINKSKIKVSKHTLKYYYLFREGKKMAHFHEIVFCVTVTWILKAAMILQYFHHKITRWWLERLSGSKESWIQQKQWPHRL